MHTNTDPTTQAAIAEEVNERLQRAQTELVERYARGRGGEETSVTAPSGTAYKEEARRRLETRKLFSEEKQGEENRQSKDTDRLDEEPEDKDADDDPELRRIRESRLRQIRSQQTERLENLAKGHGQFREVVQDEFLAEVTSSQRVVCHFYHREFIRCAVMDKHLVKLAGQHIETKFIKINAEKAPFFVDKLKIMTMPTVALFIDGICIDKILGFEGLTHDMPAGKEDEWPTIVLARLLAKKNMVYAQNIVDEDGAEAAMKARMESARQTYLMNSRNLELDDDDDDLLDN